MIPYFQHTKLICKCIIKHLPQPQQKTHKESREFKRNISDSGLHYNIFSDKMHNHTPFKNSITHYWFLTLHSLTFYLTHATHKPLPSYGTRYHIPSFYLMKSFKPKFTVMQSRLHKTNHSCFAIYTNFFQTSYHISAKKWPHLIQNALRQLFNPWISASLFQNFLDKKHHVVKRAGSWTPSLGLYLEPVMIQLDLVPTNFQLTVTSPSWNHSPSFFLSWLNILPANF